MVVLGRREERGPRLGAVWNSSAGGSSAGRGRAPAGARATRSSGGKGGGSSPASSERSTGAKASATSADAGLEAAAQRLRKLNERIIETGKGAGETTLVSYEKALTAIAHTRARPRKQRYRLDLQPDHDASEVVRRKFAVSGHAPRLVRASRGWPSSVICHNGRCPIAPSERCSAEPTPARERLSIRASSTSRPTIHSA